MSGIYIHIPFCHQACHYCNFHFSTNLNLLEKMVEGILQEMDSCKTPFSEVDTIYFGGGTPSILSVQMLAKLIEKTATKFNLVQDLEITLEANPEDLSPAKLNDLKFLGVNRLSIGIQSFFEEDLKYMNRNHNAKEARSAIENAIACGFENLSLDLIYGTPSLTEKNWLENLEIVNFYNVPHFSAYGLTVESRTALEKMIKLGKAAAVSDDKVAKHFEMLVDFCAQENWNHYEISNICKADNWSRHNTKYWQSMPYLGFGPSAHSYDGKKRWWNLANNFSYVHNLKSGLSVVQEVEELSETDKHNEYLMLNLRLSKGIDLENYRINFAQNYKVVKPKLDKYLQEGLLVKDQNFVQLSKKGKLLSDFIISNLFV